MRPLVVTPLPKELAALAAALTDAGHEMRTVATTPEAFEVCNLGMMCAAAGHGKAQFALTTQHLLDTRGPFSAVVVVGAAGALSPDLRPGDVIVGTESVEHDYKTRFHGEGPPPRHTASLALVSSILGAQPRREAFRVLSGPIASGDEDIVDARRAQALGHATGAMCVAWEGAGGARAAAFSRVPFVEIRAVTDAADAEAVDSYRVHLAQAVGHAMAVVLAWLAA